MQEMLALIVYTAESDYRIRTVIKNGSLPLVESHISDPAACQPESCNPVVFVPRESNRLKEPLTACETVALPRRQLNVVVTPVPRYELPILDH